MTDSLYELMDSSVEWFYGQRIQLRKGYVVSRLNAGIFVHILVQVQYLNWDVSDELTITERGEEFLESPECLKILTLVTL